MRFRETKGTFRIYAVAGTNTVAFGIDCDEEAMENLLGFTVEKEYVHNDKHVRVTVMGFKVFRERIENPVPGALYSTYDNPIQSFTWEDFSVYPGRKYIYHFTPLYGNPLYISRGKICSIEVATEPEWLEGDHSVFFNRGVASSQAYAMKFGNRNPDEVPDGKAYEWLSRGLKEAIINFIGKAGQDDHIYGCFYEFRNDEILSAFRDAADRKVKIDIIYDAKDNEHLDKNSGSWIDSFPKIENEEAIVRAKLDKYGNQVNLIPRQRNKSYLCHNKFMILQKSDGKPSMVWTGSTNISKGGIFGQTNVGHAIENQDVANAYLDYWNVLKEDPDSRTLKNVNEKIHGNLSLANIPNNETCILSPRNKLDMLQFYADLLDSAEECACITLAFGVHEFFEKALSDNTSKNALTFLLLEKDDPDISDYVYKNYVVKAVGSYLPENSVFKWVKETNTFAWGLNTHVMYVHTKFLLKDPLSKEPIVVSGSANFSKAATDTNDENMVVVKGNRRVADIYFTEFMRVFNHYYFRWIVKKMMEKGLTALENPAYLSSDWKEWTGKYKAGNYKRKKIDIFKNMYI